MRGRFLVLFFLSGVSALVYELVWQRCLNLLFGVSKLAVSAVLVEDPLALLPGGVPLYLCLVHEHFAD